MATATSSFIVATGHLATTPTIDVLVACLVTLGLSRVARTGDRRCWVPIGVVAGIGLHNQYTVVLLVVSVVVGAVVTEAWRRMVSWWLLAGAVVAVMIWTPQLLWQIEHDWPVLSFARSVAREQGGENRATEIPFQLFIVGPLLAPFVGSGLWALWRRPAWSALRFMAFGYMAMLSLILVTGGKGYYAAGVFRVDHRRRLDCG